MKRALRRLAVSVFTVIVFVGEFGCVITSEPLPASEAPQNEPAGEASAENMDKPPKTKGSPSVWIMNPGVVLSKANKPVIHDSIALANEPNGIILETCEPEPDEVAVPLNVSDGKECHKVHALAVLAKAHSVTYLEVDFTWHIADESKVKIIGGEAAKHNSSIELEALYDIFSHAGSTAEPRTELTVCVEPKAGWQNKAHPALCRSLPVYAVANMQGSWCFNGNNIFQPDPGVDCQTLTIEQDGRFLRVDNYGLGTIYEKQMDFYWEEFEFRTVENSGIEANGLILAGEDVEGSFNAFRLPL